MLRFLNINIKFILSMSIQQRVTHPEHQHHQTFLENLTMLEQNIKTSQADMYDILYTFFSQFIRVSTSSFEEPFKTMVFNAIYNDSTYQTARLFAAHHIKQVDFLEWPDRLLGKIYLSDIRNKIVFVLWSQHRHMITAQWSPETTTMGTEEQNATYKKVAHCIGGKIQDPKDIERLGLLLTWMHFLKLIYHVKTYLNDTEQDYDTGDNIYTFNSFSGACLHKYNQNGISKLIWELFLDVYTYDNVG